MCSSDLIKNPKEYYSGYGVIAASAERIAKFTKKPLIIGGSRALRAGLPALKEALTSQGIAHENVETFSGFPSDRQFRHYSQLLKETDSDCIIALGGGRALDTAKAAAMYAGVSVITIPTVAATCAAYAALVIEYDDEGAYVGRILLERSPDLVLADTGIMLSTPDRYLFSGVVDTFAKYYEVKPVYESDTSALHMDMALHASKLAFDRLEENVFRALRDAKERVFAQPAKDVVDSIVYLAGFAGAFQTETGGYCFAHPFYHISARFPATRHRMHGEKVAFGILTQLFLEGKDREYIENTVRLFDKYGNAFTLPDLGLDAEDKETLLALANEIKRE